MTCSLVDTAGKGATALGKFYEPRSSDTTVKIFRQLRELEADVVRLTRERALLDSGVRFDCCQSIQANDDTLQFAAPVARDKRCRLADRQPLIRRFAHARGNDCASTIKHLHQILAGIDVLSRGG